MHKHTISFTDFNGNPRTKDVYFNLTEAELTKIQKDSPRGIQTEMQEAIDSGDTRVLLDFIEMLVHKSYGVKSEDGMEFEKSPELMRHFENSAYYSDLYMSLFQDEGRVGAAFITAIMPAELIRKAEANVRGGNIAEESAERAKAYQAGARDVFDQRRAERVETVQVQEAPQATPAPDPLPTSQQYIPQNQPVYPTTAAPVTTTNPASTMSNTDREELEILRAKLRDSESTISRPPHESGPGFEVKPE